MQLKVRQAFSILDLDDSASVSQVKSRYYQLAKEYHPDSKSKIASEERFIEITDAYNLILEYFKNPSKFSIYSDYTADISSQEENNELWKGRFKSKEEWVQHLAWAKARAEQRQKDIFDAQKKAYEQTQQPLVKRFHLVSTLIAFILFSLLLVDYMLPYQSQEVKIEHYDMIINDINYPTIFFTVEHEGRTEDIVVDLKILYEPSIVTKNKSNMIGEMKQTQLLHIPMKFALKIDDFSTSFYEVQAHSFLRKIPVMCFFLSFSFLIYFIKIKDYTVHVFTFYSTWIIMVFGFLVILVNGTAGRIVNLLGRLFLN